MDEILTVGRFPKPVDPDAVRADWAARGYSCHHFTDPPGREWRDFVHDTNELVTVVEGRLDLEIAGQRVTAGPRRRSIHPPRRAAFRLQRP